MLSLRPSLCVLTCLAFSVPLSCYLFCFSFSLAFFALSLSSISNPILISSPSILSPYPPIHVVIERLRGASIVSLASMSSYVIAVDEYGECYVWGAGVGSADGALRSPACAAQPRAQPGPVLLEVLPSHVRVKEVACGLGHALLLAYSGQCFSWGNGGNGRLGLGDVHDRISAAAVAPFSEGDCVASVQCGASHSMALTAGGLVYCWGKVCLHPLLNPLFFALSDFSLFSPVAFYITSYRSPTFYLPS